MTLLGRRLLIGSERQSINALALARLAENHRLRNKPSFLRQPKKFLRETPDERRIEARVTTNDPAQVRGLKESNEETLPSTVLDVSRSGMRLHVPVQFAPGEIIQILTSTQVFMAEIRHSRTCLDAFIIGVRICEAFPRS